MPYSIHMFDVSCVPSENLLEGELFIRKKYKEFSLSSVWVCDCLYFMFDEGWVIIAHNFTNYVRTIVIPASDPVYRIIDKANYLWGVEKDEQKNT